MRRSRFFGHLLILVAVILAGIVALYLGWPAWLLIIVAAFLVAALATLLAVTRRRLYARCPNCGHWAGQRMDETPIPGSATEERAAADDYGYMVSDRHARYQITLRCRHCGYTWTDEESR